MALSNFLFSSSSSSSSSLTISRSRIFYSHFDSQVSPHCSMPNALSATRHRFSNYGISFSIKRNVVYASTNGTNAVPSTSLEPEQDSDYIPMPIVLIDQDSDSEATIVQISFGDRLGALIDTMRALKDLELDVAKGTVSTEGPVKQTKFFITRLDSGRKVEDPDMLERIRLTVINNLLKYHPVCVLTKYLSLLPSFSPPVSVSLSLCLCLSVFVWLSVSPMKGLMRFGKKDKLSSCIVGLFEILERIGTTAYRLALPPELAHVHVVFYVSMLRKYHPDPSHVIQYKEIPIEEDMLYQEMFIDILDK
ncbi:ACT domain-containing protein ACR12-like [Carica papaya]|uniref:ACT domain-containing protein ACR12-like n=1 Tax=Carica papaya TaxID=3649 RepID=UPI000B8CD0D5|nr:ACT domain-containing protein ACR12-like [Carica papaya]